MRVFLLDWQVAMPVFAALVVLVQWNKDAAQRLRWWITQYFLRTVFLVDDRDLTEGVAARATRVGGVDISFVKGSETDACAALVVVDAATLEVVHARCMRVRLTAPYVPGYLAFREVGFLVNLVAELRETAPELLPDAILVDGNGVLHPNGFGLACHLGVLCGIPTVGVGKTLHHVDGLTKTTLRALAAGLAARGEHARLVGRSGRVWGAVVRTTDPAEGNFSPVVVSVGHGVSLDSAVALVKRCTLKRVPEPVRQADLRSREWLRQNGTVDGTVDSIHEVK